MRVQTITITEQEIAVVRRAYPDAEWSRTTITPGLLGTIDAVSLGAAINVYLCILHYPDRGYACEISAGELTLEGHDATDLEGLCRELREAFGQQLEQLAQLRQLLELG